ncbi:MAG TPA: MgtC/SapB family protein [Myxococcota bacterium]|nr:MgtC/SapB family protein [Myxococcota bacterium]
MPAIEWTPPLRFAVALGLGFLIGLERESTRLEEHKVVFGGVRTHPLISLYGFGCAWLSQGGTTFMLPVGLLSLAVLTAISYFTKLGEHRYGSKSEISALLTFVVGALALLADVWMAAAIAVVNTFVLSEKPVLEKYVERLDKIEFLAALKFLIVSVIILPVVPNEDYTQFHLNPYAIWQVVVLVSSIGFFGYVLAKRYGESAGMWLSGILGGLVSSTAVAIASGRRAEQDPQAGASGLQTTLLAGAVLYPRLLIIIAFVNSQFVWPLAWRFAVLGLLGLALATTVKTPQHETLTGQGAAGLQNPFELSPALLFAGLYVVLSVITVLVRNAMGDAGLLGLSAVVGVTDIVPFIMPIVRYAREPTQLAMSAIVVATMSNVVVRGIYYGALVPAQRRETIWRHAVWALLHLPLVLFR